MLREGHPRDEVHEHERALAIRPDIDDRHDVHVAKPRGDLRFLEEAAFGVGVAHELGEQAFHREEPHERAFDPNDQVDAAHSAARQLTDESIAWLRDAHSQDL